MYTLPGNNHRHPVSPSLAPTWKKQTKWNNRELFFPLSAIVACRFFFSTFELLPNLTRPLRTPGSPWGEAWHHPPMSPVNSDLREQGKKERKQQGPRCKLCSVVEKLHVETLRVAQFPRIWSIMAKHRESRGSEREYIYIAVKQKLKYCRWESL